MAAQALRGGLSVEDIHAASKFDPWFIRELARIVEAERAVAAEGLPAEAGALRRLKALGFSDRRLAELAGSAEAEVAEPARAASACARSTGASTPARPSSPPSTPYMYSTYEGGYGTPVCEADPSEARKVIILGGGPNRIGQGIEFDYCCVHAAYALKEAGFETIMVNCNPETVSTDYDTSDRLYFEPLTAEDVIALVPREQERGSCSAASSSMAARPRSSCRRRWRARASRSSAPAPMRSTSPRTASGSSACCAASACASRKTAPPARSRRRSAIAERIGYPVVIRPSYVLGGRAMEIVHDRSGLQRYMREAVRVSGDNPVLIDRYLNDAIEVDVDCIADGESVYVAGVMEHIEEAGIHSGDSACALPPYTLSPATVTELKAETEALAKALGVVGLMNVQYAIKDDADLRAGGEPARRAHGAVRRQGDRRAGGQDRRPRDGRRPARRVPAGRSGRRAACRGQGGGVPLQPLSRCRHDPRAGDEIDRRGDGARHAASSAPSPSPSSAPASCCPARARRSCRSRTPTRAACPALARRLADMGFKIMATRGTAARIREAGLAVTVVNKVLEGRPHCVDAIRSGEVQLVINTASGPQSVADSFAIRRSALTHGVPHYTTMAGARAAVHAIAALKSGALEVAPLQSYFRASF